MAIETFVTFMLNDQLFGINIKLVREINKHLDLTEVPHAPPYVRGLANLRGQIVTVLDLKERLGMDNREINELSHNVVLKTEGELSGLLQEHSSELYAASDKVGLLVDDISEVVTIDENEIESPPANINITQGHYLSGVIKLENTLINILSPKTLLKVE